MEQNIPYVLRQFGSNAAQKALAETTTCLRTLDILAQFGMEEVSLAAVENPVWKAYRAEFEAEIERQYADFRNRRDQGESVRDIVQAHFPRHTL